MIFRVTIAVGVHLNSIPNPSASCRIDDVTGGKCRMDDVTGGQCRMDGVTGGSPSQIHSKHNENHRKMQDG